MALVYVLNGPNLNLLGAREPSVYGGHDLAAVERRVRTRAKSLSLDIEFRQTNHEGVLIDWVHEALSRSAIGIVINPGALTHTSIALHDALRAVSLPTVEVHISNIYARESFRHHSFISAAVQGVICGLGIKGYEVALETFVSKRQSGRPRKSPVKTTKIGKK